MQALGLLAIVVGLVLALLHAFQHRDDWWGVGYRIVGSLLVGYIIMQFPIPTLTISESGF